MDHILLILLLLLSVHPSFNFIFRMQLLYCCTTYLEEFWAGLVSVLNTCGLRWGKKKERERERERKSEE